MTFYPPPLQQLTDHPSLSLTPLTPLSSTIDVVRMFRYYPFLHSFRPRLPFCTLQQLPYHTIPS